MHFFPNGLAFSTGSDDASCRLYDLRARQASQAALATHQRGPASGVQLASGSLT